MCSARERSAGGNARPSNERCASTATHESTGQVIDDSAITTKVKKAIFDEPSLKVAQINVETYKSVVQLSGWVDSTAQIGTAGSIARSVDGVTSARFMLGSPNRRATATDAGLA